MIFIAFDSNILYNSDPKSLSVFSFNHNFDSVYNLVNIEHSSKAITILLPEIVLLEIWKQRCDYYQARWKALSDTISPLQEFVQVKVNVPRDAYPSFLQEKMSEYVDGLSKTTKIPICNNDYFPEIVERAIHKRSPFEGREKQSDKGFKDTILFFSLLDFARTHPGEYYLLTNDNKFFGNDGWELKAYFRKCTGQTLNVINKIADLDDELKDDCFKDNIDSVCVQEKHVHNNIGNPINEPVLKTDIMQVTIVEDGRKVLKRINRDIISFCDKIRYDWESIPLNPGPNWPNMVFEGIADGEVAFNASGIFSLLYNSYVYLGGVHGGRTQTGLTYDLNSGNRLTLSELLGISEQLLIERVNERIRKDIAEGTYHYYEEYYPHYTKEEELNFFVDIDGIKIILGEYEAGCYASGIHHVTIASLCEIPGLVLPGLCNK